jgi:hypothetical protein
VHPGYVPRTCRPESLDNHKGPEFTPAEHCRALCVAVRAMSLPCSERCVTSASIRILGPAGNLPAIVIATVVARLSVPASKLATACMLDPATTSSSLGGMTMTNTVDGARVELLLSELRCRPLS